MKRPLGTLTVSGGEVGGVVARGDVYRHEVHLHVDEQTPNLAEFRHQEWRMTCPLAKELDDSGVVAKQQDTMSLEFRSSVQKTVVDSAQLLELDVDREQVCVPESGFVGARTTEGCGDRHAPSDGVVQSTSRAGPWHTFDTSVPAPVVETTRLPIAHLPKHLFIACER